MSASQPQALFDLDEQGNIEGTPSAIVRRFEALWWTPIVRAHGLSVEDLDLEYYCADTCYGYLPRVPAREDAWVHHCCTQKPGHSGEHKCDRCEMTW